MATLGVRVTVGARQLDPDRGGEKPRRSFTALHSDRRISVQGYRDRVSPHDFGMRLASDKRWVKRWPGSQESRSR